MKSIKIYGMNLLILYFGVNRSLPALQFTLLGIYGNDNLYLIHKQSTTAVLNQVDIPRACTGILIHIVWEFVLTGMGNRFETF